MQYKIVEFIESKSVAVIPSSWINQNEVKWNDKFSPYYSKRGLFPKNKWKSFSVKQLTSKVFDNYGQAESAMSKILKLNKTDVETDDIASETEILKRRRESSSSEEDDDESPLKSITPVKNLPEKTLNISTSEKFSDNNLCTYNLADGAIVNDVITIDSNNFQTEYNAEDIVLQNENIESDVVWVPRSTLDLILAKINNLEKSMEKIEYYIENNKSSDNCTCVKFTQRAKNRCSDILPLNTVQSLIEFDEKLLEDSSLVDDFQSYLTNRIIVRDLRSFTRSIVTKTYSMELQGQVNYTGARTKTRLKGLLSTDTILNTIYKHVPELIILQDEMEKIDKAEAELKYQLQHFYDRKRFSFARLFTISANCHVTLPLLLPTKSTG